MMSMNETTHPAGTRQDRIFDIVAEQFDVARESLDRKTSLIEIGDSLTRVEAIMELEDAFEIALPDNESDNVRTLGDLIDLVDVKLRDRENAVDDATPPPHA